MERVWEPMKYCILRGPRKLFKKSPPVVPSHRPMSMRRCDETGAWAINKSQIVQGHPEVQSLSMGHHVL